MLAPTRTCTHDKNKSTNMTFSEKAAKPWLEKIKVSQGGNVEQQAGLLTIRRRATFPSTSKMDAVAENLNLRITKP